MGRLGAGRGLFEATPAVPWRIPQVFKRAGWRASDANWTADMTLRRLPAALALSALVAVLVHLAAFGLEHAPGRSQAPVLLGMVAAGLVLAALVSFFEFAFGRAAGGSLRPASPIATTIAPVYAALGLASAGFCAFALIELAEGHLSLGGVLRALAAAAPVAALVLFAAGRFRRVLEQAGGLFGRFVRRPQTARIVISRRSQATTFATVYARGARRGRAPPHFL